MQRDGRQGVRGRQLTMTLGGKRVTRNIARHPSGLYYLCGYRELTCPRFSPSAPPLSPSRYHRRQATSRKRAGAMAEESRSLPSGTGNSRAPWPGRDVIATGFGAWWVRTPFCWQVKGKKREAASLLVTRLVVGFWF